MSGVTFGVLERRRRPRPSRLELLAIAGILAIWPALVVVALM